MIKLIIKNPDGSQTSKEITQDTTLSPSKGQQFYFDNTDGSRKYTFNLSDEEESVELIFAGNGERLVLNLKGMAELIKQSENITNEKAKTVLGIMDDNDGMKELNETALNNEFQGDKVISDLKELLSDTSNPDEDYQNGIIIDDFGSLLEKLDAAAAGGELGQGSGFTNDPIDPSGEVYGVDARGRGTTTDRVDPNGEVDGGEDNNNPLLIIGDVRVVYEAGLDDGSNPGNSDIVNGTFRIESPDGISIVTIGGREFTVAQLLATNTTASSGIDTGEGTLVINGYTGVSTGVSIVSFEYTLKNNLDHNDELADGDATNNSANTISDFVAISVRDSDGDIANGQLQINIIDDVPTLDVGLAEDLAPKLIVDETDLSVDAKANFAGMFTVTDNPGADGKDAAKSSTKYTLDVKAANADSGLIDMASGEKVVLTDNAGVIEGRTELGGLLVFTVSVDVSTGEVTLDQKRALTHPDKTNPDDEVSLSTNDLVTLTREEVLVDNDGDTVKDDQQIGIGSSLVFKDDGPTAGLNATVVTDKQTNNITLTVDESAKQQANPADTDADRVSSADFVTLFKVVGVGGVTATDVYGTDGAGSVDYSLSLTNASGTTVNGVSSGLFALGVNGAKGAEILLSEVNGSIVGTVGTTTYFTISNAGTNVTFTQAENVWHSDTTNNDDTQSLVLGKLNQVDVSINLTQTVTDADGDADTSTVALVSSDTSVDVGAFNIKDDGPSIDVTATPELRTLILEESFENLRTTNGWQIEHGGGDINGQDNSADTTITGDHGVVWDLNSEGVEIQRNIVTTSDDGSSHAELDPHDFDGQSGNTVMTTTVNLIGSNSYELSFAYQPRPSDKASSDMKVTFGGKELTIDSDSNGTLTITTNPNDNTVQYTTTTDANGWITIDVVYSGITGTTADLTFEGLADSNKLGALIDDISLTGVSGGVEPTLIVDETNLNIDDSASFSSLFTVTKDAGTDGEQSHDIAYSLGVKSSNIDSGLIDTATGDNVLLKVDAGKVVGYVTIGGVDTIVFTVAVDTSGNVTLDQVRAVVHPDAANHDDAVNLSADDLITLTRTDTITDRDGDKAEDSESINIGANLTFKDDGPSIDAVVNAESTVTLTTQDAQTEAAAFDTDTTSANFGGVFASTGANYGADGAGNIDVDNYKLSVKDINSGLTSNGVAITLSLVNGEVVGLAGTIEVFKVSVSSDGKVTLTQYEVLDHPNTNSNSEIISLVNGKVELSADVTVTDKDGDTASDTAIVDLGGNLRFQDDGPAINIDKTTTVESTLTVDETDLTVDAKASFAGMFTVTADAGADGEDTSKSSTKYTLDVKAANSDSGLVDVASGEKVVLTDNAGVIEGRTETGGVLVFTVSVNESTAKVTLDQKRAVKHPDTTDSDDEVSLSADDLVTLTRTDVLVDNDGDKAEDSESIDIGKNLLFKDDGPTIDVKKTSITEPTLTVDETDLTVDAKASFAGMFTVTADAGADGEDTSKSSTKYTLDVKAANSDSGLVDVASGEKVVLSENASGVIEGRTETGGVLVFTVSVDTTTGEVTLDQKRALTHPDATNSNDEVSLSADDLVTLTRTDVLVDNDGDKAEDSESIDIGKNLLFKDDGPTIDLLKGDDSNIELKTDDIDTKGSNFDTDVTVANFGGVFSISPSTAYGADGAGTTEVEYKLEAINGTDSGLTSGGLVITLNVVNGEVIGSAGSTEVFKVSVNSSGVVTLKQSEAIDHVDENADNDATNNDANLATLVDDMIKLSASAKITDKDGDSASDTETINIGSNLKFTDDTPNASDTDLDVRVNVDPIVTNLTVVLDISGSMRGQNLEIQKTAAQNLIEEYSKLGEVNVKIVTFNAGSSSESWITNDVQGAKDAIDSITTASGSTNYEAALQEVMDTYDTAADPEPSSTQDVFYFLSDGEPTAGDADNNIDAWKDFANAEFDDVFVIGMGANADLDGNDRGSLEDITNVVGDADTVGHPAVKVTDFSDLSDTLISTVNTNVTVTHTGGTNTLDYDFGADGAADGTGINPDADKLSFEWGTATGTDSSGAALTLTWEVSADGKTLTGKDGTDVVIKVEANLTTKTYDITEISPTLDVATLEIPFTVTDADGDSTSSNVTLDIQTDSTPTILGDTNTVYEKGLDDSIDNSEVTSGKFKVTSPDGIATLTIGGVVLTQAELLATNTTPSNSIDTVEGSLVITGYDNSTGEVSYEYTLKDNLDHTSTPGEKIVDNINLELKDSDGDITNGTLKIDIIDDVPVANADTRSMGEATDKLIGNVYSGTTSGDVADDIGADSNDVPTVITGVVKGSDTSSPVTGNVGTVFDGEYGTLKLNSDGSYTYDLDNTDARVVALNKGDDLTEVFTYTITDSDGDKSTTTLTITIDGNGIPTINSNPDINDPESRVYEKGLDDSSDESEKDTGVFKITSPDGISKVVIGTEEFTKAELLSTNTTPSNPIDTVEGILIITGFDESTGLVSYKYTLKDNLDHPTNKNELDDNIPLKVIDPQGDEANGTLTVKIVDDEPVANADTRSMNEKTDKLTGNVYSGTTSGDVADDIGADSNDVPTVIAGVVKGSDTSSPVTGNVGTVFDGEYGTLKLNSDGSYTYDLDNSDSRVLGLNDGDKLNEVFTYTIVDSDGDKSTTTLTITIDGKTDNIPPVVTDATARVSDEGLVDGLKDTTGANPGDDTTNKIVVSGNIASDVDGDSLTVKLTAPIETLTSEGKTVVWTGSDTDTLIGKINNGTSSNPDWQEVVKINVDSDGKYTLTQSNQIDHAINSVEDIKTFNIGVEVSDGKASDTGKLTVIIEDDMPKVESSSTTVDLTAGPVNLVFTLDISGSMGSGVGSTGKDRLEIAIESMKELVAKYESLGSDVLIQVNTFNATANGTGIWMTSSQLSTFLSGLNHSGKTNFEDALKETEDNYTLSPNGGDTYVYFLSDGNPTTEINDGANEEAGYLDSARVTKWNDFVTDPAKEIDKVFAVGIGTSVSTTYLSQVSANVNKVDNPEDLSSTLQDTIVYESGSLNFSFGADGAADGTGIRLDGDKEAFTWETPTATDAQGNDVSVVWTSSQNGEILIGTISGETVVKLEARDVLSDNPTYEITQLDRDSGITDLTIPYTVTDGDGDSATANLVVDVIIDTIPTSFNETNTVQIGDTTTNLVITFDVSGSMAGEKLTLAKEATKNMIDKYDDLGDVKIMLTSFAGEYQNGYQGNDSTTHTSSLGSVWLTVSEAKAYINGFTADGGTNYDEALLDVEAAMASQQVPASDQLISYFVSDGNPTFGMADTDNNGSYETRTGNGSDTQGVTDDIANRFKALPFTETYSIGIGSSALIPYLSEIAIDGNADVIIVENANDLDATLQNSVSASVTGNVTDNIDYDVDGAGGIVSIKVDGVEYTSSFTNLLTSEGGKLSFNIDDGSYSYKAASNDFNSDTQETFEVKAKDADGDETKFDLTIKVDVTPHENENIIDLDDTDTIDLTSALTNHNTVSVDGVDMTDGKVNNLNIDLEDIVILDDDPELDELKIFGESGDKVTLEGGDSNWTNSGKTEIDGEVFNVYEGTNGTSNIKVLIDEDVSIEPDL